MRKVDTKQFDFLIYGDLCAFDLIFGEYLARKGARVLVARKIREGDEHSLNIPKGFLQSLPLENISWFQNAFELVKMARCANVVITFTGSFATTLRFFWFIRKILGLPPVINHTTGSDFAELLAARSLVGIYYRYFARTVALNMIVPYPHVVKNVIAAKLKNVCFLRYPYILPLRSLNENSCLSKGKQRRSIRFFHPSHLDFGVADNAPGRTSTKGNDRFIRALLRALDEGFDAECLLLYRGPDREYARKIIESSEHSNRFLWKESLSREDLHREMTKADVVVDQFDVGGLGGIAIEAMALSKAVMIFVEKKCVGLLYSEMPPVINAQTENEIYCAIIDCFDRNLLVELGVRAEKWVQANHSGETCLDLLMFHYCRLMGRSLFDFCEDSGGMKFGYDINRQQLGCRERKNEPQVAFGNMQPLTVVVTATDILPEDWNSRIEAVGCRAGMLQTAFWGALMEALGRGAPIYVKASRGRELVAMMLVIHSPLNSKHCGSAMRLLFSILKLLGLASSRIEIGNGPVFLDPSAGKDETSAFLDYLDAYAKRNRIRVIRVSGFPPLVAVHNDQNVADIFSAHGYTCSLWATYLVDIQLDEDSLLMSLEHSARKGIKKAAREGVRVVCVKTWEEFRDRFWLPYRIWNQGGEEAARSLEYVRQIWNHPQHDIFYHYYIAVASDETVLAVLGMYVCNGVATEITSGLSPEAIARKLPAQDLLHWEMFLEAKRLGCHTFDLAGVSPEPVSPKEENIRKFKKKFGGRYVEYLRYAKDTRPRIWINFLWKIRCLFLKFRSKRVR